MGLLESMMKNTSTPFARKMTNSFIQENTSNTWDMDVPLMNVAMSGKMDTGFQSGITIFAGPSRHYKSLYALTMLNQWFKHNEDPEEAVAILFDTEYGITEEYLNSFPYIVKHMDRIIHMPVNTVEELRHEIATQTETLYDDYKTAYKKAPKSTKKPNVFLMVDSIGQVASKKETNDAVEDKATADMTRAKQIKSLFRIITSKVKMLGIPTIIVAHTYSEMSLFPKQVVSGGTGVMYSADSTFILGKSQEKDGTELKGYKFTMTVEKSRFIRDKTKIPISVHFEHTDSEGEVRRGILKYSGLLDIAKDTGFVQKCKVGRSNGFELYIDGEPTDIKTITKDADVNDEFWDQVFEKTNFKEVVESVYSIPTDRTAEQSALAEKFEAAVTVSE
jgi:hypothetical protein